MNRCYDMLIAERGEYRGVNSQGLDRAAPSAAHQLPAGQPLLVVPRDRDGDLPRDPPSPCGLLVVVDQAVARRLIHHGQALQRVPYTAGRSG